MKRRRSWKSKAERWAAVDWRARGLLAEASAHLLAARIRLAVSPFKKIAPALGSFVPPTDPRIAERRAPAAPEQAQIAEQIRWAVASAARHLPFKAVCLPQAMAAHAMLRKRGIASAVHFGARRTNEKPIDAHAWLDAAGVEVTGYPLEPGMTEIGCFV